MQVLSQYTGSRKPIRTSIPIVRQLMVIIEKTGTRIRGVQFEDRITAWRRGKSGPQLQAFQELAQHYGYDIVLVPQARLAAVHALLAATPQPAHATPSGAGQGGAGQGGATAGRAGLGVAA